MQERLDAISHWISSSAASKRSERAERQCSRRREDTATGDDDDDEDEVDKENRPPLISDEEAMHYVYRPVHIPPFCRRRHLGGRRQAERQALEALLDFLDEEATRLSAEYHALHEEEEKGRRRLCCCAVYERQLDVERRIRRCMTQQVKTRAKLIRARLDVGEDSPSHLDKKAATGC